MKRRIISIVIMLMVAITLTTSVCGADQPVKPLIDYLRQPTNSFWQRYGYSEDTLLLFNIIANMQNTQRNEKQTTSLRAEVAELERTIKNLEALVEANATTIATLASPVILLDQPVTLDTNNPNRDIESSK